MSPPVQAEELSAKEAETYLNLPAQLGEQGVFLQKKYFKQLSKPFTSSGSYHISGETFLWRTLEPAQSQLVFDGDTLWQESAIGKKEKLPVAGHYIAIIKALITVDLNALTESFTLGKVPEKQCLLLTPKEQQLTILANTIELCVNGETLTVQLNESSGNYSQILISQTSVDKK